MQKKINSYRSRNSRITPVRIDADQLQRIINGFDRVKIEDLDEKSIMCIKVLRNKFNNYNLD